MGEGGRKGRREGARRGKGRGRDLRPPYALQVVCMNVYDVALDFILLDAFDDLEHPPNAIVAVFQNSWITVGMKTAVSG